MTGLAAALCIAGATATLASAFAWSRLPYEAGLVLAIGGFWLARERHGRDWLGGWADRLPNLPFVALIAIAAWGVPSLPAGIALLATVLALAGWDLESFERRLQAAGRVEDRAGLERHHLSRLAAVSGSGLLLGLAALYIRLRLTVAVALLLALAAILALSRAIALARRGEGD